MPFEKIQTLYEWIVPVIFFAAKQIDWIFIPDYTVHLSDKTVTVGSTQEDCLFTCEADPDCISIDYMKATSIYYHNIESELLPASDVAYDYYYICDERHTSPSESLIITAVTKTFHDKALSTWQI